jgi:hypothetical protein
LPICGGERKSWPSYSDFGIIEQPSKTQVQMSKFFVPKKRDLDAKIPERMGFPVRVLIFEYGC